MSTIFITGCGSGFGRALAQRLLAEGHAVVATDPEPGRLADLQGKVLRCALDVRDIAQVQAVVAEANAWSPVDVLVNNGGFAVFGTQEEADLDVVRDQFDVNVFGAARVTQALLPTLRKRSGTVVQLSSVAGRTVFPESGWYAATKHAIEAMSEALYQECCTFGVKVRLIEPGSFDTSFLPTAIARSTPRSSQSPYAAQHGLWDERKLSLLEPPQDPTLVVNAIQACLSDPRQFLRIPVGPDAERMLGLLDAVGADAYILLNGRRNGARGASDDREVPGPGSDDERVRAAHRAGQLDFWSELPGGPSALSALDPG